MSPDASIICNYFTFLQKSKKMKEAFPSKIQKNEGSLSFKNPKK
jgi:hypothetical protein